MRELNSSPRFLLVVGGASVPRAGQRRPAHRNGPQYLLPLRPGIVASYLAASHELRATSLGTKAGPAVCLRRLAARGSALAALLLALLPSCSTDEGHAGPNPKSEIRNPKSKNPLAFQGQTLDGWAFDLAERNARRRILVYLFDPAAPAADTGTRIAQRFHAARHASNLEVVGVVVPPGYTPLAAQRIPRQRPTAPELAKLAKAHLDKLGADFPCVPDPDAAIVERYTLTWGMSRLDQLPAFYPFDLAASDATRPVFPRHAEKAPDPADYLFRRILQRFHLDAPADVDPLLGHNPPAPPFAVTDTAGKTHSLRDYEGRTLVLILFARDCPICKDILTYLGRAYQDFNLPKVPKPSGGLALDVLAICTDVAGDALKALAAERAHPFPTAADPDWSLRTALRYRGTVPDIFVIGPDATVRFRHRDASIHTPALLHMEISVLLGLPVKPMLERGLYSGDQACRICHPRQHADWTLTRHACAWESLVRLGRENDPKCVRCHVVGHAQGGFHSLPRTPHLANVQCEACHGLNGCSAFTKDLPPSVVDPEPRRVPEQKSAIGNRQSAIGPDACLFCHDPAHSPRFDFETYRKRILHGQRAELLKLPRAEREARLRRLCAGARDDLFDPDTPYVGSAACAKCHPTEAAALKNDPHTRALDLLRKPAPDNWSIPRHKRGVLGIAKPECLRCHTTGHGRPGGYPATPAVGAPDHGLPPAPAKNPRLEEPAVPHPLAGVGCEACHGPGAAHAADPKKPRAILKLAGGCPECTVLPTCRQCHDDANDPDFDPATALPKARHPVGKAVSP